MRLFEMEILVRVAEAGSMSAAARQLHLTPAAVSATVGRVEEELGMRLFERTTRTIHPTNDGLVVLDGCQEVLAGWRRTLEKVQSAPDLTGTVHLSAPVDTMYQVLSPVVVAATTANPKLQVVLHTGDSVYQLHQEAIDMAIRYGPLQDSSLSARKLTECPGVLVAAPAYLETHGTPRAPKDLEEHRCLALQLSDIVVTSWTLREGETSQQVHLQKPLCGDGYIVRRWAIEGLGIARKSLFDVIDDLEHHRLVRVLPQYTTDSFAIHIVFPSRRYTPARVRALDAQITAAVAERTARCEAWLRAQTI
ncbi:MAG: LysR family transcriptional regulator [Myxococcota bacterium]